VFALPTRLFVVAAHPDDDTIGCGGTIALVARCGGAVRVAYVSDGSRSHPGSRRFPPERIATLRAGEARASLAILGVREEPVFFALLDGSLGSLRSTTRAGTVERLAREIAAFDPDLVLAPWQRDPHPDHMAAAALTSDAISSLPSAPQCLSYEVWLPIRGADVDRPTADEAIVHTISLDAEIRQQKRRAVLAHATQTTDLIDDDPDGFRIDESLLARWTGPSEILYESRVEEMHAR
jgi:LmbE family N-acetylglucosaminyl deacetylase